MDLNYLYYRKQIEMSTADAAHPDAAREIHRELARNYEKKISEVLARSRPKPNATMALAITAREVGDGER